MVKHQNNIVTSMAVNIIILIISVMSILGLVYLTQFAFHSKLASDTGTATTEKMNKNKIMYSKFTVVLLWTQIAISVFYSIWMISSKSSK